MNNNFDKMDRDGKRERQQGREKERGGERGTETERRARLASLPDR